MDQFTYLGSSISSTKTDVNIHLSKLWIVIIDYTAEWFLK